MKTLWKYFWVLVFIGALPSIIQTLWVQWRVAIPEQQLWREAVLIAVVLIGLAALIKQLGLQGILQGLLEALRSFFAFVFTGGDRWSGARYLSSWESFLFFGRGSSGWLVDGKQRRLSPKVSYQSIITSALAGAGKTSSLVLPNIYTLDDCSMVITDVSGELYDQTSKYLVRKGFRIRVLNLMNLERSLGFNPVVGANSFSEISKLSSLIIRCNPSSGGKQDAYWNAGAEKFIRIILTCLRNQGDEQKRHLGEVKRWLAMFDHFAAKPGESQFGRWVMENTLDDPSTWDEYKTLIAAPEKVVASFLSTADVALLPLGNREVASLLEFDELALGSLRTEKTVLYLICRQQDLVHYSFIVSAFFAQLFDMLLRELNPKQLAVYNLIDEAGQILIPGLDVFLTTARKYRVATWLFLQDYSQLESRYSRSEAQTVMGGIGTHLHLAGSDLRTAQQISQRLGHKELATGKSGQKRTEALMTAEQVITMKSDEGLLLHANKKPFRFRIRPFFKSMRFRGYARMGAAELPYLGQSVGIELKPDTDLEVTTDLEVVKETPDAITETENASA